MTDLSPETPSFEAECRILLDGAKSLVRAIRNRERHPDGMDYLDMETDSLDETIVNLFGAEHRGPVAPATVVDLAPTGSVFGRVSPPAHSRRVSVQKKRFAF